MFRAKYSTIAEIKIPANAQANKNFYFETQNQLQTIMGDQRVIVEAIECYPANALAYSPLTSTNVVATAADIQNTVLTLMFGTFEGISMIPLASLVRILPEQSTYCPGVVDLQLFREMSKIDWTKSHITIVNAAPTTTVFSYIFNVFYDYLPL